MIHQNFTKAGIFLAIALWLLGIGIGFKILWTYSTTSGAVAPSPSQWPVVSQITPKEGKATLVMFVHPRCACTRASLSQLNLIMHKERNLVAGWVVFLKPADFEEGWEKTDSWATAQQIPGVRLITDLDGVEAKRFGALTSGYVVLYGVNGELLFSGGVTASRGHIGSNQGEQRIISFLEKGHADQNKHEVYGCPMESNTEENKVVSMRIKK